jgi:hypothetical protein
MTARRPQTRALLSLGALALAACATDRFAISAAEQSQAENDADTSEYAQFHAAGLEGTWIPHEWQAATCRWSSPDKTVAVCQTGSRIGPQGPWHATTMRYRRDSSGDWQIAH